MKTGRHTNGFTIAELAVVIIIIGILAAISIVAYRGVTENAGSSAAAAELKNAQDELKLWVANNNGLTPTTLGAAGITNTGTVTFEYVRIKNNSEYCLSATPDRGDSYVLRSDRNAPAQRGACSTIEWVAGPPLAVNETPNSYVQFSQSIDAELADLTMYVVVGYPTADASYATAALLSPQIANNGFRFQTAGAGSTAAGYRIDTSASTNLTASQGGVRAGGTHIGWMQVSDSMTVREYAYDKVESHSTASLAPSTGFTFSSLYLGSQTASIVPEYAVVYRDAHNETTRAEVMNWLATKFSTGQTF